MVDAVARTDLISPDQTEQLARSLWRSLHDRVLTRPDDLPVHLGRKPVLVAGWLIGLPVPLLLIWAPAWGWIVFASVLLGINQGFTWSTTVIMKIDLVGPERRGFAMGLNEAAGYGAVALTALATGFIAQQYGLRPEPFWLGLAYAGLGLSLSTQFVRETRRSAAHD